MRLTGKIQRYKRASGSDLLSFRIVHNYYRGKEQTPTNKLIKTIITISENKLNDVMYQWLAWDKIEKVLVNLKKQNLLSESNAETIRESFAKRLRRPARPPIVNLSVKEKARERVEAKFGDLLK